MFRTAFGRLSVAAAPLQRSAMGPSLAMAMSTMPSAKPCPDFSSGPCKKRPGWSTDVYKTGGGSDHRHHHRPPRL